MAELASSVVVGVSNDEPMLPYRVALLDGFTASPRDPEKARINRSPESSGFGGVVVMR